MKQINKSQIEHNNKVWNCIFSSEKMCVFSEDKGDWKSYLLVGTLSKEEFHKWLNAEIDKNNSVSKMDYLASCMCIRDLLQYPCEVVYTEFED